MMKITAVISIAPYLTDKDEHNAVYKVKKRRSILETSKIIVL